MFLYCILAFIYRTLTAHTDAKNENVVKREGKFIAFYYQ